MTVIDQWVWSTCNALFLTTKMYLIRWLDWLFSKIQIFFQSGLSCYLSELRFFQIKLNIRNIYCIIISKYFFYTWHKNEIRYLIEIWYADDDSIMSEISSFFYNQQLSSQINMETEYGFQTETTNYIFMAYIYQIYLIFELY